jgi:hypothetical protein
MVPDPNAAVMHVPQVTSWYMNPFFMASFGAVVALGFVLFALAYFVFVKLKVGQREGKEASDDCKVCTYIPCKDHGTVSARVGYIEKWIDSHDDDYKELRRRVDSIERKEKT